MVVKHTNDNTYMVYDEVERWLVLEIHEYNGCLCIEHYGREECTTQARWEPEGEFSVEMETDYTVLIHTRCPNTRVEHHEGMFIVQ